jgi:hypothetical protein
VLKAQLQQAEGQLDKARGAELAGAAQLVLLHHSGAGLRPVGAHGLRAGPMFRRAPPGAVVPTQAAYVVANFGKPS